MKLLRLLPLLLLCSTAWAAPIRGTVDLVHEPAPTREDPRAFVEVVHLLSDGITYRITDSEAISTLRWFERKEVVVDGKPIVGSNDLAVHGLIEPALSKNMRGVLYRTKRGWAGAPKIEIDGRAVGVSGPNYLTFLKVTKDLSRREIAFHAYPLEDRQGRLVELVVMEIEATATEDLVLTEAVVLYRGEVPAGSSVWVLRRSLIGISAKVRASDGSVAFALWDHLQIGRVIPEATADAKPSKAEPARRAGINDALERSQ